MRLSLFVFTLLTLIACTEDPPEASFTMSNQNCLAPCAVYFSNNSKNALSFHWDFGDGKSSVEPNPYHVYETGGRYTITLTATNYDGTSTQEESINLSNNNNVIGRIATITINSLPNLPPSCNNCWDPSDGPDLSFAITDGNNNFITNDGNIHYNFTENDLPSYWSCTSTCFLPQNTNFSIVFKDDDGNNSFEVMGQTPLFNLGSLTDYPPTLELTNNTVSVTLGLDWN